MRADLVPVGADFIRPLNGHRVTVAAIDPPSEPGGVTVVWFDCHDEDTKTRLAADGIEHWHCLTGDTQVELVEEKPDGR